MEFDDDDDFELPPNSDEASPPVRERKLKRLKKGTRVSPDPVPDDQPESGADVDGLDLEESNEQLESGIESEGLGVEGETKSGLDFVDEGGKGSGLEMDSGFDDLGGGGEVRSGFDAAGVKRALDFESGGEDLGEKGEEVVEEGREMGIEEAEKKRRSFDGGEEEEEKDKKKKKKKKKNKRAKSGGDETISKDAAAKSKRRVEKERQEHLKELHAETQRLLRETREAAFKPVPVVQKPISSILEKIRKRKLEVSKKSMAMNTFVDDNGSSRRVMEFSSEGAPGDVTGGSEALRAAPEKPIGSHTEKGRGTNVEGMDASADHPGHETVSSEMDVDEVSKQAFRAPIDDTQDLFSQSQTTDSKDENDTPISPSDEVYAPSNFAMDLKLKFDSAPPDYVSSDEEDNDKENVNPRSPGMAHLSSSPIHDPVKAFVDDEAEEEDDGDHDQFLFPDKEEDEADEDLEELNDMIATGYEEKPIDSERRNELHQKWLEQQDASGTEKIMEKLMFGSKLRETEKHAEEEEDQETDDEAADVLGNDSASGSPKKVSVQMNLRIAKQMMSQMFSDDDVYLSSDDDGDDDDDDGGGDGDGPEKRPAKPCSFKKAEEHATFLSPAEDESCSEVFGRIKKLNIVPDTKKGKTPAVFNMQLKGRNGIIPKSSFIRESNNSLPSSRKRGLSTARCSFIFGRDDSNSTSTTSVSEDSSDLFQRDTTPARTTAKFSSSQMKSHKEKSPPETVVKTDTSFFEILRQNSLHSKRCSKEAIIEETIQTVSVIDRTIDTESVGQTSRRESVVQMKRTDTAVDRTIQSALASFRVGRVQSRQTKNLVSM